SLRGSFTIMAITRDSANVKRRTSQREKCGVTLRHRAGRLNRRQKDGPPEQGKLGRAYQIDAGWMGGRSIDRSRKPPCRLRQVSVDAGLADVVAVGVELADPVAGPIAGRDHIGGAVIRAAGSDGGADDSACCEADAKAETPRARLRFAAGGDDGAHGE